MQTGFSETALLDALEGIAYLTAPDGALLAVGTSNWMLSMREVAGAPPPDIKSLIGKNIYDVIQGDDVRSWYRNLTARILSGSERQISFNYRCDAPDMRREMRMCMSGVRCNGHTRAILYHSVVLSEVSRPPLPLLDPEAILRHAKEDQRPIVTLCSICAQVKMDKVCSDSWVNPEFYYRLGGKADVRISHGLCPGCYEKGRGIRAA